MPTRLTLVAFDAFLGTRLEEIKQGKDIYSPS